MDFGILEEEIFLLFGYSDANYAGYKVDRKSTSGTFQFLGPSFVSWHSKKQNAVALSTVIAEYIVTGACCAQLLWIMQQLRDLGIHLKNVPIRCDNTIAINITKIPVQHSRTKHIKIMISSNSVSNLPVFYNAFQIFKFLF